MKKLIPMIIMFMVFAVAGYFFANFIGIFPISDVLAGLAVGILGVFFRIASKDKRKYRRGLEHGSARWGTKSDIVPFVDKDKREIIHKKTGKVKYKATNKESADNIILTATESLTMDNRPKNPAHGRNKNVLVIGGSGSGKTRFYALPNIMQLHSSFCIVDPKGDILKSAGKLLKKNNFIIKVLNLIDFLASMGYNPFKYIRTNKDIISFVNVLMKNTDDSNKKGGDDFWPKAERLLYSALISYIITFLHNSQHNMNVLLDMINSMEVREDDPDFEHEVDYAFGEIEKTHPNHFSVRLYKAFKKGVGKTLKSILISCEARLAPFYMPDLQKLMSHDEMELDLLGDRKTALFIILDDMDSTYNFIAAMLYSQIFPILARRAMTKYNGSLPIHVRCILDEFANCGEIPKFDEIISVIRSRNISANILIQSMSQLKKWYKDTLEIIEDNCDTTLFLGGRGKDTVEKISKMLGRETIDLKLDSETRGHQSSSTNKNYQVLGRELMTPDEISRMDGGKCILSIRGLPPFLSKKYDIKKHPNYKYLAEYNAKNTFDIDRYLEKQRRVRRKRAAV